MAHIIVVGNEKGGAGKSTVSMHVATALCRDGAAVAVLDLDLRQQSLARYLDNRRTWLDREGLALPTPETADLALDEAASTEAAADVLDTALAKLSARCTFVLIDCPGSHTALSQAAHARADTLITPLNDSFVDFDLLARIDTDGETIRGPSVYSEMVWSARQRRAQAGLRPIDWVVLRNRLGTQAMVNKTRMDRALRQLSRRIGFRTAPGFHERVVFRELFPRGLTLLDLPDIGVSSLTLSHVAARQELRALLKALALPGIAPRV